MEKYFSQLKNWAKKHWEILTLIFVSAIIYRTWLSFGIFTHADYWFWFSESMRDFLRYSAWDSQTGLGSSNIFLWMWAWKLLPGIFGYFGFDSNVADKFVIFWPWVFLTPIFSYLFAKQVLKNNVGAFVSALVFSFNTYYLAINTQGHFSLSLAGTFAPLAMFFFWRYFDTNKWKNLIASAITLMFVGGYDFRIFYILFFIILAVPFWFLLMQNGNTQKMNFFRKHFWAMTFFFGLIFLFNLFWLLPTVMTGALANNSITSRALVGNNFSLSMEKVLTLFHPFWNASEPVWFDTQKVPVYFVFIPIMVIWGAYVNRKNKRILFWFFVALVSVFVSKQNALPLKGAYIWLHQNFPGFNAFREASKFYFATILAYTILIGAFIAYVSNYFAKNKFLKYGVVVLASLIFLWNAKPILVGDMHRMFVSQQIAGDEIKIRDYMFAQTDSFRIMWNPSDSKWASFSSFRPKINEIEVRRDFWKNIKDYSDLQGGEPGGGEKNKLFFGESFATRLLSQSAVRYVISDQANFFMIENLVNNPQWKKIELGLKEKQIFENKTVRPRVYLTELPETIHREIPFQIVELSMQNASRWNFTIENLTNPVWINFAESYHPDWQVVCGDARWFDLLSSKKTVTSEDNHQMTDAKLNAFWIDPVVVREKCIEQKKDKIKLSLMYRPQSYLYLGEIISLGTVLIAFLMLVFWKEKNYNNKVE